MARHLVSRTREIAATRKEEYETLWGELRDVVTSTGAHAWRFVSADRSNRFVEYLEFASDQDPRLDPSVRRADAGLAQRFPDEGSEEWEECQ